MHTVEIEEYPVCIAHQLHMKYESKCRNLHGHNYRITVIIEAPQFNDEGMVVDFSTVKEVIRWLDHSTIGRVYDVGGKECFFSKHIKTIEPSTAENLAFWLYGEIQEAIKGQPNKPVVIQVTCSETDSTTAIFHPMK